MALLPKLPFALVIGCLLVPYSGTERHVTAQNIRNYSNVANPFLFLLREPAVQDDLGLSEQNRQRLVTLNEALDQKLLSARNRPAETSQRMIGEVYARSREEIEQFLTGEQIERLQQIAYRIRGISFINLPEPREELQLRSDQEEQISAIFDTTAKQITALQDESESNDDLAARNRQLTSLREQEQRQILELLDTTQQMKLRQLVGAPFDLSRLARVQFKPPELADDTTWINSPPQRLAQLRGKVVVVHFWAFGCINCIHNYPHYKEWQDRYRDRDVVMIGIHTPETSAERDESQLRQKVKEEKFDFAVIADTEQKNWESWGNSMWPSVYLIDKQGRMRYWWYGELNWQGAGGQEIMRAKIDELLSEQSS